MKTLALIILSIGLYPCFVQAQSALIRNADNEFEMKNYSKAIHLYEKVLRNGEIDGTTIEISRRIGECYEEINDFSNAVKYYNKYLENTQDIELDLLISYYELILKSGLPGKALEAYQVLDAQNPGNQSIKHMIDCCTFAIKEMSVPDSPEITPQKQLNSSESEFGLAICKGRLIFSSQRFIDNYSPIQGRTNEGYSDLYSAEFDSTLNVYSNPKLLSGKINTTSNEGTFAFHSPTNTAYLTQCIRNPEECKIIKSYLKNGKWGTSEIVNLGDEKYDYAHPAFNQSGTVMYFSSDLPGGFGGKDLWEVTISKGGKVGKPKNLGNVINTAKDEMFPTVVGDSILFFASEGHLGMGGLDIFYTKIRDDIFEQVTNVGYPINSTSDDFSILFNANLNGGYFCSNRLQTGHSDDIFAFYHNIFFKDISGTIVDSILTTPVPNAKIEYKTDDNIEKVVISDSLGHFKIPGSVHGACSEKHTLIASAEGYQKKETVLDCSMSKELLILLNNNMGVHRIEGNIKDIISKQAVQNALVTLKSTKNRIDTTYSDKNGNYSFENILSNDYIRITVEKQGYLKDSRNLLSPDNTVKVMMMEANNYHTDFQIYPIQKEVEFTIRNIYYEFDKYRLLPASKVALNELINLLNENPQIKIQINSHTDSRGTYEYNKRLSQKRGQSVVSYLKEAGISSERLKSQGYGESKLAVKNAATEAEHQQNRRTTFEILNADEMLDRISNSISVLRENSTNAIVTEPEAIIDRGQVENILNEKIEVYRIQLMAVKKQDVSDPTLTALKNEFKQSKIYHEQTGGLTKYQLGDFLNRALAEKAKNKCIKMGFYDCFIITRNK